METKNGCSRTCKTRKAILIKRWSENWTIPCATAAFLTQSSGILLHAQDTSRIFSGLMSRWMTWHRTMQNPILFFSDINRGKKICNATWLSYNLNWSSSNTKSALPCPANDVDNPGPHTSSDSYTTVRPPQPTELCCCQATLLWSIELPLGETLNGDPTEVHKRKHHQNIREKNWDFHLVAMS